MSRSGRSDSAQKSGYWSSSKLWLYIHVSARQHLSTCTDCTWYHTLKEQQHDYIQSKLQVIDSVEWHPITRTMNNKRTQTQSHKKHIANSITFYILITFFLFLYFSFSSSSAVLLFFDDRWTDPISHVLGCRIAFGSMAKCWFDGQLDISVGCCLCCRRQLDILARFVY